ncbi:helix-turn-helix domain-containing protein [Streptomyces sp. NPDC057877]|uniref:helix-turn-helix domain-containing protein n=1 Tax=Streptomyces sp. NPDC057877 TaxID=3346269 RepID=UPI0036861E7C
MAIGKVSPDDDPARVLGSALRALQQRSGRTLRALENEVRISDSSLSRYFRGSTVPPWSTVRDLCVALKADPAEYRALWEAADRSQPTAPPARAPDPPAAPRRRPRARWRYVAAGTLAGALLGGALTAVLLPTGGDAADSAHNGPQLPDPGRMFVNRATGACLDDSLDAGLRTYPCNALNYQRWSRTTADDGTTRLRNHATGACLDHGDDGLRPAVCGSEATQQWIVTALRDDSVEIRNAVTHHCLTDSATGLRALPCERTDRQKWG